MLRKIFLLALFSCALSKKLNEFKRGADAVRKNDVDELKKAIKKDPNILKMKYLEDSQLEKTLLMEALEKKEKGSSDKELDIIIDSLFEGSDLNATDKNGYTVLYYALFNDKYVERILKNKNININAQASKLEKTCLMHAVGEGYSRTVEHLLKFQGINLYLKDTDGRNILHYLAIGISKLLNEAFDKSDNKTKGIYDKKIEDYKEIFELLKAAKFNFEVALREKITIIPNETPLELFNSRVKIKEEKENAPMIRSHSAVFEKGSFRIDAEVKNRILTKSILVSIREEFERLFKSSQEPEDNEELNLRKVSKKPYPKGHGNKINIKNFIDKNKEALKRKN